MPLTPLAPYVGPYTSANTPIQVLMDGDGMLYGPGGIRSAPTPELLAYAKPLVLIDPDTGLPYSLPAIVVSSGPPDNEDGRPDGTIWIQTTP